MPTGRNIYPYDATIEELPNYPLMPAVTDADAGKQLVVAEDGTLTLQASAPASVATAADIPEPGAGSVFVQELGTNTVDTGTEQLGPEYVLFTYGTIAALSATTTLFKACLPFGKLVTVTAFEVVARIGTTNDASNRWTITLRDNADTPIATYTTEQEDPDEWIKFSGAEVSGLTLDHTFLYVHAEKSSSPGDIDIIFTVRVRDVLKVVEE